MGEMLKASLKAATAVVETKALLAAARKRRSPAGSDSAVFSAIARPGANGDADGAPRVEATEAEAGLVADETSVSVEAIRGAPDPESTPNEPRPGIKETVAARD